jgi:hypothetical protein
VRYFIVICLLGAAVLGALLLRRISRQRREAYKHERDERHKRLTEQFVGLMDEKDRKEYLKSHEKDVA